MTPPSIWTRKNTEAAGSPPPPLNRSVLLPARRCVLRVAAWRGRVVGRTAGTGATRVLAVPGSCLRPGGDVHQEELRARLAVALEADAACDVRTDLHERRHHTTERSVKRAEVQAVLDRAQARHRRRVRLVVDVEGLLRRQGVTDVRLRLLVLGTLTGTQEGRDGDRNKDCDDQDDHHQLDQGEPFVIVVQSVADSLEHVSPPVGSWFSTAGGIGPARALLEGANATNSGHSGRGREK